MFFPASAKLPFHMNADGRIRVGEAASETTFDMVIQYYGYDMTVAAIAKNLSISKESVAASILFYEQQKRSSEMIQYLRGSAMGMPAPGATEQNNEPVMYIHIPDGGGVPATEGDTPDDTVIYIP